MLANTIKRLAIGISGAAMFCAQSPENLAQQPPSTRYQPVGYQLGDEPNRQRPEAPPSVHIPPANAQALPHAQQQHGLRSQPPMNSHSNSNRTVMQTSFQDPAKTTQEPAVPEILQRAQPATHSPNPTTTIPRPPAKSSQSFGQGLSQASPAQFSNQLNQMRQAPSVDQKLDDRLSQMKQDFEELQRKAASRNLPGGSEVPAAAPTAEPSTAPASKSTSSGFSAAIPSAVPSKTTITNSEFSGNNAGNKGVARPSSDPLRAFDSAAKSSPVAVAEPIPSPSGSRRESVDDFLKSPNQISSGSASATNRTASQSISDARVEPASMQEQSASPAMASNSIIPTMQDPNKPVSAIRLSAPSISVESFGPQSIGINKPAIYKVVATNETNRAAERVVVSVDLPVWVEIEKINMTAGEQQKSEDKQFSRLIWKIDQIPANGSQTIMITAIPRKAEPFNLGIEWTIAPRAGTASIQVTQPKLEMSIVGPEEVHFGETAPYEVTVRNAGNGSAENVAVMLSESLGGERGNLGDIPAGSSKSFTVNLVARTPGELELGVSAVADNQAESNASRKLVIRRANLGISITGPTLRYAGTTGEYIIKLSNTGDAAAEDVVAAMGLPTGVKFLKGIEAFKLIDGGLRWQVGRLEPGQTREYKATCQLDASGDVQVEVGTQGKGALQSSHACVTKVQTIADLSMQVNDPPGPLTTGDEITYEIHVENQGTRAAKGVDIFMILSEGMEPKSGSGLEYRIPRDGALQFATVPQIDPGQKLVLKVNAVAYKPGTHVFRAHLVCEEADAREIKEGTSRFFGDEVANPIGNTANEESNFNNSDFKKNLK